MPRLLGRGLFSLGFAPPAAATGPAPRTQPVRSGLRCGTTESLPGSSPTAPPVRTPQMISPASKVWSPDSAPSLLLAAGDLGVLYRTG